MDKPLLPEIEALALLRAKGCDLARVVGVQRKAAYYWLRGRAVPNEHKRPALCRYGREAAAAAAARVAQVSSPDVRADGERALARVKALLDRAERETLPLLAC